MRAILIILTILIYGCSTKQEPKDRTDKKTVLELEKTRTGFDTTISNYCEYNKLANDFKIRVHVVRYRKTTEISDSCLIKITVLDKVTEAIVDSMKIQSNYLFGDLFEDCNNVLSYSTKFNIEKQIGDNYFGDIVVCDLNFDNKEDLAIICDSGGNGGPSYHYYLQGSNKTFYLDQFLTDSMNYFPTNINFESRTLVTYVHAGACCVGEHIYRLGKETNKWKQTSHKILGR